MKNKKKNKEDTNTSVANANDASSSVEDRDVSVSSPGATAQDPLRDRQLSPTPVEEAIQEWSFSKDLSPIRDGNDNLLKMDLESSSNDADFTAKEFPSESKKKDDWEGTGAKPKVPQANKYSIEKAREAVEKAPLIATVYLAAPFGGNRLAFVGKGVGWRNPQGVFERVVEVDPGYGIYKGTIPVPRETFSPFKFVQIGSDGDIEYEGNDTFDNRTDELLPDSWNFFIYKPRTKNFGQKVKEKLTETFWGRKKESEEKIVAQFLELIFNRVLESILTTDWDDALDLLEGSLDKIKRLRCESLIDCARKFVTQRLQDPELQVNFDHLLILLVGAEQISFLPGPMKEFLYKYARPFSQYLHNFRIPKRNANKLFKVLDGLAHSVGAPFFWLPLRSNRHHEVLRNVKHELVVDALLSTMMDLPELILSHEIYTERAILFMLRSGSVDDIYERLMPILRQHPQYRELVDRFILNSLLTHKTTLADFLMVLGCNFIKLVNENYLDLNDPERGQEGENSGNRKVFEKFLASLFNRGLSDMVRLACSTPAYLLPTVIPMVEEFARKKLETLTTFNQTDYAYFSGLEEAALDNFPSTKKRIDVTLMKMTHQHLSSGSFQSVPSFKLTLRCLSEKEDVPFLDRPSFLDLQKAVNKVPRRFFQNLHTVLKAVKDKDRRIFRKGETRNVLDRIEKHTDLVEEMSNKVQNRRVPLIEITSLQDPQVADYLKHVGLGEKILNEIRQEVEELRKRHKLFASLYNRFARLNIMRARPAAQEPEEEEEGAAVQEPETVQVFDPNEWEGFLRDIDVGHSIMMLHNALHLPIPLDVYSANWLEQVRDCALFIEKVWQPQVESSPGMPLARADLKAFIDFCATRWAQLAGRVANGQVSFQEMEEILRLQPDPDSLVKSHLQIRPVRTVQNSYRDFRNLQELRHLIGPFVAALRFFNIKHKEPINRLYEFVNTNLINNWNETTLAQVYQTGLVDSLNGELNIDPERPETLSPMKFISSLVTDQDRSPLIDWLRQKTEQEMEAMGKILQGALLEAYGQLQTLKTRIAPFLQPEFDTYQDLLRVVRESEQRFAERISNRVQPINCKWLANMLHEIQAAVRASVISPSEDAKEKLSKLDRVLIEMKTDGYSIEIQLRPTGSLSMEELKQAFQLLDITALDDDDETGDLVARTRNHVGLILRLSEVFAALFASGYTTYNVQTTDNQRIIELDDLEAEIREMQEQLENWNDLWSKIDEMPHLALFSRSYLLHLTDLMQRGEAAPIISILRMLLPSVSKKLERSVTKLVTEASETCDFEAWLTTRQLFDNLRQLHELIEVVFYEKGPQVDLPPFLASYGRSLGSHFIDKAVVILNVPRELLVGSSLAAYVSVTKRPIEPSRILFVTATMEKDEVERFMKLWALETNGDLFIIVHVERLSAAAAGAVRDGVSRVLPERRTKLLLLAQQHHRVQSTKSLGARLGLVSDRLLDVNFTADQLRECFSKLLPKAANMQFFTSKLPGCGKSQQVMRRAADMASRPDYYRIPVRVGSVEELLASLKKVENISEGSRIQAAFLHLDIAHSTSLEFNDILLSLLIHGALYDPKKPKLGFWAISPQTTIAIEFASPFGPEEYPIIAYLGEHRVCECTEGFFTYDLAVMPRILGQRVTMNRSNALVAAGKFLQLKHAGLGGLAQWDALCEIPETIMIDPLPEEETFRLLVAAFQLAEHRQAPTFSAINAMASFLHRHISGMLSSIWFNSSSKCLFEDSEQHARIFKLNVFELLLRVANDCVSRCWSVINKGHKQAEMDWTRRQRAMFLLGLNEDGQVMGMNVVGRDAEALKAMFHPSLLPILQHQCLQFQELRGFKNLMQSREGAQAILNAIRSLLLLDGTATSLVKVFELDGHPRNTSATQRIRELMGPDLGYVLTGDNMTKMMFALYRIRCGLPVMAFGEAGVGKSALFRFLIQSLLGHEFRVLNVNSGTTVQDVSAMIDEAMKTLANNQDAQVFLFFDEMNTAEPPVIAFLKELMLDRHCDGTVLPDNLHLLVAANPYRSLQESDKEAAVGLSFRFAQSAHGSKGNSQWDSRNLVYRVNELPLAFYDHVYDFGHLCDEAEDTYIEEICEHTLSRVRDGLVKSFIPIVQKSHRVARALSSDPDSAVSLRDATRAAQLFHWFLSHPAGQKLAYNAQAAVDLTIYLVYAFRFKKRKDFLENVFGPHQSAKRNMTEASRKIAKLLYEEAHGASIGSGAIALNDALCENLFALYVCVLNGIFLIIVGRPGSSKSLSVEILKLVLSPGNHTLRQKLGDLPALTELYFQCSPLSTSSGFKALFESAQKLSLDPKTMLAMVVLDELGLADLSPEKPIKVLHSELERKAVLTSGEQQQSPYSVVALSNWVVDAAQVNRGILISRTQADRKDLLTSAKQLSESLIAKYVSSGMTKRFQDMLTSSLECIVDTYEELDRSHDIGGGHFFSMRDFFFCVKNFVCSIFQTSEMGRLDVRNLHISDECLIQSAIRNFGGHDQAKRIVRKCMAEKLELEETAIPLSSPLELIVHNINDSSKELSVHIARHLMILNRSLIGLQLLNRHVREQLDDGLGWHVLFGSCFPGDLQVMAVTRKLRQVEQAIRTGGVLILCHADQLFESLYMVLNQQYWAQGDVTMTQIALGPSIRAIALPNGPFRIIALQDTDVALNRDVMSPAILSRFEKHELRPSHLLDNEGRRWLNALESHPVWMTVTDVIKRQKLLCGYHEESFAALALQLQEIGEPMDVEGEADDKIHNSWMRAVNPMAMIKLERDARNSPELLEVCRMYRKHYILEGVDDALGKIRSNRLVLMTNTLRHLELSPRNVPHSVLRLFDVQTELELYSFLDSISEKNLNDPNFCLLIQYDATAGPVEQFQLTKYEVEARLAKSKCRVAFVVHVDPRPANMHWVFSFGDGWAYGFVDEVVSSSRSGQNQRFSLKDLVHSPADSTMSDFIRPLTADSFRSLLLEMLGPNLQTCLTNLRSALGQFYSGVRSALGLPENQQLIQLLKECLLAQLDEGKVTWNVVEAVSDPQFDSSSSLSEGLWGAFKHKISSPLAHLLVVSDVWRVTDTQTMALWCEFVEANYPERLMLLNSSDMLVQMPVGFRFCTQPFGRLLASFDRSYAQNAESRLNGPLHWLLSYIERNSDVATVDMKECYFRDWMLLRIPPHLHSCVERLPLARMRDVVDSLFEDPEAFFEDWEENEAEVIAALELVGVASFASVEEVSWSNWTGRIRSWKAFAESATRLSLAALSTQEVLSLENRSKFLQSITSIEVSPTLHDLLDRVEDLSQLWLGLRITKRMQLFDPEATMKPPELLGSSPDRLIQNLTDLVIGSVIRPRMQADADKTGRRGSVRQADLSALLNGTAACNSPEELTRILRACPTTKSIVWTDGNPTLEDRCSSCGKPLLSPATAAAEAAGTEVAMIHHLTEPSAKAVQSLFQDHQKFLFYFERVAELFIHHRRNNPHDVREFLRHLLADNRLRVSWRFLTVIVRSVLSTRSGSATLDSLLATIRCNTPNTEMNANARNLLRSLLVCADGDVRAENPDGLPPKGDWALAAMTGDWTVDRIQRVAFIRKQLTAEGFDAALDAIEEWARWRRNEHDDPAVMETFLFFVLRFCSAEGDQTRLSALFREPRVADDLGRHPIIGEYIKVMSPLSLGFALLPGGMKANHFEDHLFKGLPLDDSRYRHYRILQELEPDWAPFIARLTLHLADVAAQKKIRILRDMAADPLVAVQSHLPGIDNHPYLASFQAEAFRWFICSCGTANCVGNCGRPTPNSICVNCGTALSQRDHQARDGVRQATPADFQPPKGIATHRTPSTTPAFTVREKAPAVTRFCLLLNALALMNAALNPRIPDQTIALLLGTLPLADRIQQADRRALIQLLSRHVVVHLDLLNQLLVTTRQQLTWPDKFRVGHLLLHKLLNDPNPALLAQSRDFARSVQSREGFEVAVAGLLANQRNLEVELDRAAEQLGGTSRQFLRSLTNNETSYWTYARRVFADRRSVQLELARDNGLRRRFPFLNLLLDDDHWARKLDALQHLGEAVRFAALTRTVLQGAVTLDEANRITIAQGLKKIAEAVEQKAVLLDRGRAISKRAQVLELFEQFKALWDRFSQLPNVEQKTFLDYFECQQVDINVRPKSVLELNAPMILILTGNDLPETTFACQLLSHAVETASAVSLMPFVQPYCRAGSGRVRLSYSSTAALANFDESLFAHVSAQEVDRFLSNHVIDRETLPLAESFAMGAVLGQAGSTIAEDLALEVVTEFIFKDNLDSGNFLAALERRSLAWQPAAITPEIQERIIGDLEKNRSLGEAKDVLVSAISHLQSNTEPLVITKMRKGFISDVLEELKKAGILTERHLSVDTLSVLNRHIRLEVRHAFGLLKGIISRMKGDDIFGGRIPAGWDTMMPERVAQITRQKLRSQAGSIMDTLHQMVGIVSSSEPVPAWLTPDKSLLLAIRQTEGDDWDGIQAELKMEHLGHVLLLAESLQE